MAMACCSSNYVAPQFVVLALHSKPLRSHQKTECFPFPVRLDKQSNSCIYSRIQGPSVRASALSELVPVELSSEISTAALIVLLGFVAFRAFIYFRIQYIIASMLGRYVPRGGSRVLDLDSHEGRNLYYYPDDVAEVVAITDQKNVQVVKNQAIQAGVPADVMAKSKGALRMPSNSIDAVVSIYALCDTKDEEAQVLLKEAIRLLKPGKPFIFVETTAAKWQFVRVWQVLLERVIKLFRLQRISTRDMGKFLKEVKGLEKLQYETVFNYQDPHVVGVAQKQAELTEGTIRRKQKVKSMSV